MENLLMLVTLCGMSIAGGIVWIVQGCCRQELRLDDALTLIYGEATEPRQRLSRIPLVSGQENLLLLRGKTATEHASDKVVLAIVGSLLPSVIGSASWLLLHCSLVIPSVLALIGAVLGFFLPDLQLRRKSRTVHADAREALFAFLDLVTLERLGNASASQALTAAATMSDAPLFVQIRDVLERARLEQRPAYSDLKRLGEELDLSELGDIADIMRLDEHGASLAGMLRARVKELRDAHLHREKVAAHAVNEQMTVWMVLPAIVFALIFLAPPILRMVSGP
ncbi:MAG: type II secretion system F family protein [Propionibacteriaceae bacterium]